MLKKYTVLAILIFAIGCKKKSLTKLIDSKKSIINKSVPIKNKTSRLWNQGWISVAENRSSSSKNLIELPYVLSKSVDSINSNTILIMSGGPGNSSLNMINGVVNSSWGKNNDIIVYEQRGTIYSKPSLVCPEIDSLRKIGLKKGLWGKSLDSLKMLGVQLCYEKFTSKNIDLNGYNTLESVEDIEELRKALQLDKLILYGMSYSCNLMKTYAQKYPENTEALILDSPLPHQTNYDEEAYQNIDNTLMKIIKYYSNSTDLYFKWIDYISRIKDSIFETSIDSKKYRYTKNELIDIVLFKMSSHESIPQTTTTISSLINGDHNGISDVINYYLEPSGQAMGMRYSLWISEELPEEKEEIISLQGKIYPWLDGYAANDVSFKTSKIWKINSIYENAKWPASNYNGPALILSGQFDPWTPEWYGIRMLKHLPNAKHIIYSERSHLPGFTKKGFNDVYQFINTIKKNRLNVK